MGEKKNTVPESQSDTAQEVHVVSQGVYVNFEIEGIDRVKALIQQQKDLIAKLEFNVRDLESVLVRLNARVRENPAADGSTGYVG